MQNAHSKPILNASLPAQFRQIRIELAREPGHPEGDASVAYLIIAPLDANDRIDPTLWLEHHEACRITRLRQDEEHEHGRRGHRQGSHWLLQYDSEPDAVGFNYPDVRFMPGE